MNRYQYLLKNTKIFAVANLGSKLLTFILVPIYTYVLTTEEFGTVDLLITTISLLLPLVSFDIYEATLRFTINKEKKHETVFSNSIFILGIGCLIFLILSLFIYKLSLFDGQYWLFYTILIMEAVNSVCRQFAKGIGKSSIFAINGILNTAVLLISNILFLIVLNLRIRGYLLAILVSYVVCNIYCIFSLQLWKEISISFINKKLLKEMLRYSIPLIPTAIIWWVINASDRYVIIFALGTAANGIYAIAYKIPSIINIINTVFTQAWQMSAMEEFEKSNNLKFYSNIYNTLILVMFIGASIVLLFVKPVFQLVISNEYYISWKYVPFLLLSVVFASFSSFLGAIYMASQKTIGALITASMGAIINLLFNILLIDYIGLHGPAFATFLSFLLVWIIRIYDTKKLVILNINKFRFTILFVGLSIQCIFYYYFDSWIGFLSQLIVIIVIILILKKEILNSIKTLLRRNYQA